MHPDDHMEELPNDRPDLRRTRRQRRAAIDLSKVDRLPPHSLEAEQGVLGCCLIEPNTAIGVCVEKFKALRDEGENSQPRRDAQTSPYAGTGAAFYDLRHKSIYETLVEMDATRESAIDLITVRQKLKDRGQLDAIGGVAYLNALVDATPSAANLPFYADIVVEKHLLRKAIQICTSVVGRIYDESEQGDVESLLDDVEKEMLKLSEGRAESREVSIKDATHSAIQQIEDLHSREGKCSGIETGFTDLDKITSGLQASDMFLIAARPSQGKTSLAMNIVEHVGVNLGIPVGVFSMEMSVESLAMRLLCSHARVNLQDIRQGFMAEYVFPKLTNSAGKIIKSPIYIDDSSGISIGYLRTKARRMHQMHGIKLLVVDYIQLMKSGSKLVKSREQEIADVSMGIKALAKELKIPILVLAQLNREVEKREAGAKPKLSDLRECGGLEQDADVVGMIYRPKMGKEDSEDPVEQPNYDAVPMNLLIAKHRNGPTGEVHLTFLKSFTRFESAAKVSAEDYK